MLKPVEKRGTICSKCGQEHFRFRDAERTKPQSYCTACHAQYMRLNRPKHPELNDDARRKANARSYANVYQRRGKVTKKPCELCGSSNSEKHHEDYSLPLAVRWLCRGCHLLEHSGARHLNETITNHGVN